MDNYNSRGVDEIDNKMSRLYKEKNYYIRMIDELEDTMFRLNREKKCAGCQTLTTSFFPYKIPSTDVTIQVCGACLNRYRDEDKFNPDVD